MATNIAKKQTGTVDQLPSWAKSTGKGTEGITAQSLKIPRIGLLQGVSPELEEDDSLRPGMWFHNTGNCSIGKEVRFVPCFCSESVIIWRDRKEGGGIIARASDGAKWDTPDAEIEFTIGGKTKKFDLGKTVVASGLAEFGTSDPSNAQSAPIATRNINVACYLMDYPEMSPAVLTLKRSGHRVGMDFMTNLRQNAASIFFRAFILGSTSEKSGAGPYLVPRITPDGFVADEAVAKLTEQIYEQFSKMSNLDVIEDDDGEVADPKTY